MSNYREDDITFFMGLYQDVDRAKGALARLRDHYPSAKVIVRSDGDNNAENSKLTERFGVEYLEEKRLYPAEHGGAMITRILEILLDNPTRYLLKIDTDTAIYRRFNFLPEESGVFGSTQTSRFHGCVSIQGGFVGFTMDAARRIHDSGCLNDPRLKNLQTYRSESPYFARMANRVKRTGLCSFDWLIGWAAHELEIPMFTFSEVHCCGMAKNNIENRKLRYAITHPVYF